MQFAHHTRPALKVSGAVGVTLSSKWFTVSRFFPPCHVLKTHVVTCVKTFLLCIRVFDCMRYHIFLLYEGIDGCHIDVLSAILNHTAVQLCTGRDFVCT